VPGRPPCAVVQQALPAGVVHQVAAGDAIDALEPGLGSGMPAIGGIEMDRAAPRAVIPARRLMASCAMPASRAKTR